jgi:hypothetical protein
MTVRRDDEDTKMEITRRTLTINTVFSTTFGDFAYIRIADFAESTPDQFVKAVESAVDAGATARSSTSAPSTPACLLRCNDARPPASLRGSALRDLYLLRDGSALYLKREAVGLPMVVLVNEETAGAAEFLRPASRTSTRPKSSAQDRRLRLQCSRISCLVRTVRHPHHGRQLHAVHSGTSWEGTGITPDHVVALIMCPISLM